MQGKILIITGSTGIGAETARRAAARGARVVIATADEISGFELAAETGAECWAGDLTEAHAADSVLAQCLSKFGRVDGLFNAAGLSGRRFGDSPVHEIPDDARTPRSRTISTWRSACVERSPGECCSRRPAMMGCGAIVNMGACTVARTPPFRDSRLCRGKGRGHSHE